MATYADVAVVGTGLLGLATALELLDRDLTVAVVGRRTGEQHGQASRAAGAMLTVFSEVESTHPAGRVELEVSERLAARAGYEPWMERIATGSGRPLALVPGVWVIANGAGRDDDAEITAIADAARRHGHDAERVAPADVPGLAPQVRAHEALWLPSEASIDPAGLISALTSVVYGHRGCTWIDDDADTVREHGQGMAVDCGAGATVEAAHVVLAAGVGTPGLLGHGALADQVGLPPVRSGRGVCLVVRGDFALSGAVRTPNRGFACGSHLVPRGGGTAYLGATNRLSTEPDLDRRATLDEIATLMHDGAAELNTALRDAELLTVRVGHRPVTTDHLPLAGRTHHDRVHAATGTYRCGVLLAPRIARLVAEEITEPRSQIDHPYSPRRHIEPPSPVDLLSERVHGLVELFCQPGGRLPAGADAHLERFLHAAISELLGGTSTRSATLRRLWDRAPMEECLPLLVDAAGRLR